jgi:hypothetical protein
MEANIKKEQGYATTPNKLLADKRMTFKAKGLYGYIQSKPNDYKAVGKGKHLPPGGNRTPGFAR